MFGKTRKLGVVNSKYLDVSDLKTVFIRVKEKRMDRVFRGLACHGRAASADFLRAKLEGNPEGAALPDQENPVFPTHLF